MRVAPDRTPFALIRSIGVIVSSGIITFDVGKIKKHLIIGCAKRPNAVVIAVKRSRRPAPVQVARHVNKNDIRVLRFQMMHFSQIVTHGTFAVLGELTTPGPHHQIDFRVRV